MNCIETIKEKYFLADQTIQNLITTAEEDTLSYFRSYLAKSYSDRADIWVVRGQKCKSEISFFDEWSAAMQFPFYFGENWDAFIDCMRDLSRKSDRSRIFIISNAGQFLSKDDQAYADFFDIMANLSNELKRIDPAIKLKVILQETEENIPALKTKLENLQVNYDSIEGDWLALLSAK